MAIFGNHDDEVAKATNTSVTRETLMTVDMESPMSLSKPGPKVRFVGFTEKFGASVRSLRLIL